MFLFCCGDGGCSDGRRCRKTKCQQSFLCRFFFFLFVLVVGGGGGGAATIDDDTLSTPVL